MSSVFAIYCPFFHYNFYSIWKKQTVNKSNSNAMQLSGSEMSECNSEAYWICDFFYVGMMLCRKVHLIPTKTG